MFAGTKEGFIVIFPHEAESSPDEEEEEMKDND